jgi:hypothetical protein
LLSEAGSLGKALEGKPLRFSQLSEVSTDQLTHVHMRKTLLGNAFAEIANTARLQRSHSRRAIKWDTSPITKKWGLSFSQPILDRRSTAIDILGT